MTSSAQLNIGSMGATGGATRTRTDLSAGSDAARVGGRQDEGGQSFDAAMQKAAQRPQPKSTGHETKQSASRDDVAGRGEELPDDPVAAKGEDGAPADSEGKGKEPSGTSNQQAKQDEAGAETNGAPVTAPQAEVVPVTTASLGAGATAPATDATASGVLSDADEISGATFPTSQSQTAAAAGLTAQKGYTGTGASVADPNTGATSQGSVSGKEGGENGVHSLMSLLRVNGGSEAATDNQTKISFSQMLSGSEQAIAAGARGESGNAAAALSSVSNALNALAAAPGQAGSLTQPPASGPTASTPLVATPFGQPQWGNDVGQQVQWMVSQNIQRADLKLNPAHLGPIEVRIVMHHDQVQVSMTATHAQVREALETAVPRLREGLESGGFGQASVDVGQQSFGDAKTQGDHDPSGLASKAQGDDELIEAPIETLSGARNAGVGLVDHYA